MDKVKQYKLLVCNAPEQLTEKVQKHLEQGWQLYGEPQMCQGGVHQSLMLYSQAVIFVAAKQQ